jgi:hypothetical protein
VGSSRNSSLGRPQIAMANCVRRFCPPESLQVGTIGERLCVRDFHDFIGRQRRRIIAGYQPDVLVHAQFEG